MTDFSAAFAIGAAAQDALYGEPVQLQPQIRGTYVAAGPDPNRAICDLVGIFDDNAFVSRVLGSGANTHENTDVLTAVSQVDFDAALFATDADLPLQGDILMMTSRPGQPKVSISSVQPDGISRVVCLVVARGTSS